MNKNLIIILLSVVLLSSCNTFFREKTERILARVKDKKLFESDLAGIIPAGTSPADSTLLVRNFVDNWVRQQLVIHQAENNLSGDQLDFSRQLESYRNSLVIFEYEHALVQQKLDTVIPEEEIVAYYDSNQRNFLLKDNIVLIQYVKLPLKSSSLGAVKRLLNSDNPDDKNRLADLCEKQAADYFLDDQNWLLFSDLLKQIPVKTYNQEEYLKNHRSMEYQDSAFVYLVRVKDFKIKESVSPLNFERARIREVILNKRKIDLISKMHEDLYNRALKSNDFEIY